MRGKRRRALEVPPKIRCFIDGVTSCALENIEEPLRGFVWEFDKGSFHHWDDLFNHFDLFFEKFIKPRKDLQVGGSSEEIDPPFPREAVLQVLRVTRVILENCRKKHIYNSYEQHLSLLLASTDIDVVEASLETLSAFLRKAVGRCCIRDASLSSKLFAFSQGWGSKEVGLGLVDCSLKDGCDPLASFIGSTLHFEFYAKSDTSDGPDNAGNVNRGLQIIDISNINLIKENDLELFHKLVKEYNVPHGLRFSLLTRLRFARGFVCIASRHQYICIRLLAFVVLVQACNETDDLATFFNNEPEFVNELVSLLCFEDVPEKIRTLAILSLAALCHNRSHQPMVLSSVTSGSNRGILPSLLHKAVDALVSGSAKCSIIFTDALLSLVHDLVTSSPGSLPLREAGFISTILPLLKDTKPQHLPLVTTAVHILEGFLDYSNHPATVFRDLGGLDDTIARLKIEVSFAEKSQKGTGDSHYRSKGKQVLGATSDTDMQHMFSGALVSYHRKLLLKALLRAISLATYVPGSSARIGGSEESILPHCLSIIFRRAKDFGGGVFSLAAIAMSDLIHKDPTCFPVLDAADLPKAFLDAIMGAFLCSSEAVKCIPQCLDALCLNNSGLQQVRERNALRCFVKIFTSKSYIRALSGDTLQILSNGLDELMRHASTLRTSGVDMLIEILNTILKIGSGSGSCPSSELLGSSATVPMETDTRENKSVSSGDDIPKMTCSEAMVEESSDVTSVSVETYLAECVSNASRLLETILQNADTCRIFIEKKGVEITLTLFTLPLPVSVSVGVVLSAAFKNVSSTHSAFLARAVCTSIREHIKLTNELLSSIFGAKLAEVDCAKQNEVLKYLTSLEGLLSLSNFLLKGTTNMVSELGSSDADMFIDLGKAYKEILWQISLSSDHQKDEKRDSAQTSGTGDAVIPSLAGRDGNGDSVPEIRYTNPVSVRRSAASNWTVERDFVSVLRSAGSLHRHGRHGLSRIHGSRISRQADASFTDSEGAFSTLENLLNQEIKKKSPEVLISELLIKLRSAIRSFLATLVKGLTARRRNETNLLSSASRSVVTGIAKLFNDALNYSGHSTAGFEMSLSVKCRYLGKVVDDMSALIVDKRRVCHTVLVNSFYVNGAFKELLMTFEATSQLLWTLPLSLPPTGPDQEKTHGLWLSDTLQSYCRMLEYLVNASLLLSATSSSQAQLLVHPVASGLSIGLFIIPRDPEQFVRMLQSQVLDVILPVLNHPKFPTCSLTFITAVISIVAHIYSGVGDLKHDRSGATGSTGQRIIGPPLDESTIATIVEMGFPRARAEEALRSVRTNSVELATDWLFSHPEEVQEDDQLAQALALSLGTSSETSREDSTDEIKAALEERVAETPPIDDILNASMKLFQSYDSVSFPLTDLLITLCNRNKGNDRPRVVSYLIQQLKLCPSDFSKDTAALCQIAHVLALLLSQDMSTREIAAENGLVSATLDILVSLKARDESLNEASVTKSVSALLLLLDNLLQSKPKFHTEDTEGSSKSLSDPVGVDTRLAITSPATVRPAVNDTEKESANMFDRILGSSTGYLTFQESQKALVIACELLKRHVPAAVMQAVLQVTARLTKIHAIATQFLESGGLTALFSLPRTCIFPGFDSFASSIIRHLLEDPQTLQSAMELEIRQTLIGTLSRHAGRLSPRLFLTSMAPLISRDPAIFMLAAAAVCQVDSSGGRLNVVLLKEKEKEKEKLKGSTIERGVHSNDIRMPENKLNDVPGKCYRSQKRVPASLSQVIDQLLEILMSYPSREDPDTFSGSLTPLEIDEPATKEKGKSKIDEKHVDIDRFSEKSALMAKVTFVLKLMSDLLLMYVHAVGVVLRRDSEMSQLRGSGQVGGLENGGVLHHVLHHLLPLSSVKTARTSDEWGDKLSEKASWFLVVLCGRSAEGRRRVIYELVKALASSSNSENSSQSILIPGKKVFCLVDLVNSILTKNSSSSNLPGPGSPDAAKTMIDGGMIQSLSSILQVIDLDHPDAPKAANLILKALESLTRAANASEHASKLDGTSKGRLRQGRTVDHTNTGTEREHHDSNVNIQQGDNLGVQTVGHQVAEAPQSDQDYAANPTQSVEQNMLLDREDNNATNPSTDESVEFMREEMDLGVLQNSNEAELAFRVEHRTDNIGDDDDEDMGGDDDEDIDDDEEDVAAEGAALMSLVDTDVEDGDDNVMGEEFNEAMIDEDAFPDNHVIEVRLREGLAGLDRLRVLRSGNTRSFLDIAAESFHGVNADEILSLQRPLGVEGRRQNGNRTSLDRSGPNGSAFPHPLLIRPSQSVDPVTSVISAAGSSSRELEPLTFGSFDVSQLYTFDAAIPSDHDGTSIISDRAVGGVPPSFFDFSLGLDIPHGVEIPHMSGRRGGGDSRWTDIGQPQAAGQADAIAQALEAHFVCHLRGASSIDQLSAQQQSEPSAVQVNQEQPIGNNQVPATVGNISAEPIDNQPGENATSLLHQLVGAEESQSAPEMYPDGLHVAHSGSENMDVVEEHTPVTTFLDTDASADLQNVDHQMHNSSEVPVHSTELDDERVDGPSDADNHSISSTLAVIDVGSTVENASGSFAGPAYVNNDLDINDLSTRQNIDGPQGTSHTDQSITNNEDSNSNAIDPTFLEALPEDLRAEVLASQQAQPVQPATYAPPPAEEIDPEFLAALPPDIQAEVLAQQRAQRTIHSQEAAGQPVDMDNASIIATFPPELREEVLLTSSDAVLSALPSALLAEAQILRDRAASHYHVRSGFFGSSHRLGTRRLAIDRQTITDRGVGVAIGQRAGSAISNSSKVEEIDGMPLLDANALKALTRLLRLAQPLGNGLLQRLLLNLCVNPVTRAILVRLLVDMIRPEGDISSELSVSASYRLYGCQWNVVYGRPQSSDGLPPLVSGRVLEILVYLATNHSPVANILFYFDQSLSLQFPTNTGQESASEKGKEKVIEAKASSHGDDPSQEGDIPLVLFLKLLNRPLFLRSSAHLEQVMGLLQIVVHNAVAKIDCPPLSEQAAGSSGTQSTSGPPCDIQKDSSTSEQTTAQDTERMPSTEVPSSDGKRCSPYDILLQLPEFNLRNLCNVLAHEGLSDKVYLLASDIVTKLASVALPLGKFFAVELAGLAHRLSASAVSELVTLRSSDMLGLSSGSMAGAAILRVLGALSGLTLNGNTGEEAVGKHADQSVLWNLNIVLEPLWQELSDCITMTELKLGHNSNFASPVLVSDLEVIVSGNSSLSPPLPPGTQRLLPFIEAFFVLCEKLQTSQPILFTDSNVSARESKECTGSSSSPSLKCVGTGNITFARIAEKHRRLLNVFIRQNPSLLEKSLSLMLRVPRLIDFDNKRAYFRSRIRQQHGQHAFAPLRISVRRAYVLEDSYNQLRLRPTQDLKGRLAVQFQGEEGIDAGGLTREWYQLLSRVIFDKGALLFTTVGNDATFQPNPNSVYQTEHLSYFRFVGRVVAKALFDGQLLDVYFTRSFYKHILGVKVTYHDIEAVDPDYYKNLKWMLENDVSDIPDLTFSMDADEEKHILYEKTEVTDYELIPGGRNVRVTEETKQEYVDLVAEHILTTAIRPQINSFLEGFNELVPRDLISIFNDKELELLISGLPEIDFDDLKAHTEYTGFTAASTIIHWFWDVVKAFNKEDMARFLQFVTGTSKVPLEGFKALQGISGPQRLQIHKAYGAPERLPSAHTCFNQLDLPEYSSKEQLEDRLLLAIHEASEGFGFG